MTCLKVHASQTFWRNCKAHHPSKGLGEVPITMTSRGASWCLKSAAWWLFTQPFIQGTDQRKHQSSTSLAFVHGIHWWLVNSPHKGSITRKMFPYDEVIMHHGNWCCCYWRQEFMFHDFCEGSVCNTMWCNAKWLPFCRLSVLVHLLE